MVACALCEPIAAQISANKPCGGFDPSASKYPDHLYRLCEGTGTSTADDGSGTDWPLAFSATTGAGPDWITDGSHGNVLDFSVANEDRADVSVSSLSGTQTLCAAVTLGADTVIRTIAAWADTSQGDRYAQLVGLADEDAGAISRFDDAADDTTDSATNIGSGWNWACIRWSDTVLDVSVNGGSWVTQAVTQTGLIASISQFAIGRLNDSSPARYYDDNIAAVAWWHGDDCATPSDCWNAGNPWAVIGMVEGLAPLRRRIDDE